MASKRSDFCVLAPRPGTTLRRKYRGKTVVVKVLKGNEYKGQSKYSYKGQRFNTLSGIATMVTGFATNGVRFFRLPKRRC
jgi:hypothetical protein